MGLKEFLAKRAEQSRLIKERQNELRREKIAQDRMKSPEEREIERFLEEQRQKQIQEQVKTIRAKQTRDFFSTGLMDKTNIFKNHSPVLTMGDSHAFERGMFFRWKEKKRKRKRIFWRKK